MTHLKKTGSRRLERISYWVGEEEFQGLFSTPGGACPPLVVLFHEYLGMEQHIKDKAMDLVCQGVAAFLGLAGALEGNCELVLYNRVGHGFCNPSLEPDLALGNFYDQGYHERAWRRIIDAVKQM